MATAALAAESCRTELVARLRERREEIEQAALTRVHAISAPCEGADSTYALGLRTAVSDATDFGLLVLEHGIERAPKAPLALLGQARLAARNGVSLDTVLRRYFAGYTLFSDFLIQEAEGSGLRGVTLQSLLRTQAAAFDLLIASVTAEYEREVESRRGSSQERRAVVAEQLLAGELIDASELGYDFDGHHLGIVATGPRAEEGIRALAAKLDCRLLSIPYGETIVWAWLGSRRAYGAEQLSRLLEEARSQAMPMAFGEPGKGLTGWRLTHRQAKAALSVAMLKPSRVSRYSDSALLTSMLQDTLLSTSLREIYLEPLTTGRGGGTSVLQTLRAYFASERNVSCAAASLGVSRQTVAKRLGFVEERLGRPLSACGMNLEAALHLAELVPELQPTEPT